MKEINDGGRAFPRAALDVWGKTVDKHSGMTLRDYFAAHASDADVERIMLENFDHDIEIYLVTRQQARYMHADAMIAEGSK